MLRPTVVLLLASRLIACGAEGTPPPAVAIATPQAAAPASASPVAEVPRAAVSYDQALELGRAAFQADDFVAAVAAFEDALVAAPGDPRAMSELGWAAFHAGDLARADAVLTAAAATTDDVDPKIRAATLYNLGRLREAQGRADDAASAYEKSLALRPSKTVRAFLLRLRKGPQRAVLDVVTLDGPFAELELACAARRTIAADPPCRRLPADDDAFSVEVPTLDRTEGIVEVAIAAIDDEQDPLVELHLALRTSAGWFLGDAIASHGDAGGVRTKLEALKITTVDLVAGGGVELLVRVDDSTRERDRTGGIVHTERASRRLACGVGRSARPSCTSAVPLVGELGETTAGATTTTQQWKLRMRTEGGALVVAADGDVDPAHAIWVGVHPVAFR